MIGTQCWLKENLNIGIRIDGIQEQTNNNPNYIEKYCYDDLTSNCFEYGGLYQWGEMVQYLNGASNTTTWNPPPTGNVQGICPPGWHIPSESEWLQLFSYLGGWDVAGGKMKETGTAHWWSPNVGATNLSGFTALPGGNRASYPSFFSIGEYGSFYSTRENGFELAFSYRLSFNKETIEGSMEDKTIARSIRCVKD